MSDSDPQAVVIAHDKAYQARDVDGVMATYADDIVVRTPGGGHAAGKAAVRDLTERLIAAYGDIKSEVLHRFVDGEYVISELRDVRVHTGELTLASGEQLAPTGKTITQEAVFIHRVVSGKIVKETWYYDRHEFLEQIGQLPQGAQAG